MGVDDHGAQEQARRTRGPEGSGSASSADRSGEVGPGGDRLEGRGIGERVTGAVGTAQASDCSSPGGILAQLIELTEDRLGRVREFIALYEAEHKEQLQLLQDLKLLQEHDLIPGRES
jgi:hypothetical protein